MASKEYKQGTLRPSASGRRRIGGCQGGVSKQRKPPDASPEWVAGVFQFGAINAALIAAIRPNAGSNACRTPSGTAPPRARLSLRAFADWLGPPPVRRGRIQHRRDDRRSRLLRPRLRRGGFALPARPRRTK